MIINARLLHLTVYEPEAGPLLKLRSNLILLENGYAFEYSIAICIPTTLDNGYKVKNILSRPDPKRSTRGNRYVLLNGS